MKKRQDTRGNERYIGFDIHKEYRLVGGQNAEQEWVMAPRRIEHGEVSGVGDSKSAQRGCGGDRDDHECVGRLRHRGAAGESGPGGACRRSGQIAEARVKTDKEDIKRLIRLLIAGIVPEVWVPPVEVRELRGMISYRNRLVKTGTMIRNRLQSLLHRHNLISAEGKAEGQGMVGRRRR